MVAWQGYGFSNLDQEKLKKIQQTEKEINQNTDQEVILLAFSKEK